MMKPALIGFLVGLLLGFGPTYLNLREAESNRVELAQDLALSEAHSRLALLSAHIQAAEWGAAAETSTTAFEAIERASATVEEPETKRRLVTASSARDEITAAIAVRDPGAVRDVQRLILLLGQSL